ncbi:MAG TPA: trehalose-6-phosphate synthase [Candidatus Acidoferrales bacterium]|nr:trehalose-6-phosphate synthase [Candidatus Acidoferrales bacterium]
MSSASRPSATWSSIRSSAGRLLGWWSPIILSNRAPVEPLATGGFRRGSGGLVTALLTVAEATGADWVAAARTPTERNLANARQTLVQERDGAPPMRIHFVDSGRSAYEQHYSVICNPLLWFLQHYLWDLSYEPVVDGRTHRAWSNGYAKVNQDLADEVVRITASNPRRPLILVQDYQLYLAPARIRAGVPHAVLQQFVHIPWPEPHYWRVLPAQFRNAIIDGLVSNDIVGFQTSHDVANFLATCEELRGLRVDHRDQVVLSRGRLAWARAYPISVDTDNLERLSRSGEVRQMESDIRGGRAEQLIVRVDRLDPAKNIIRGFLAYERLLLQNPPLRGRVGFFAFLQPSRQDVAAYRAYGQAVQATVERINHRFGRDGWRPIRLEMGENQRRAMAAFRSYDVLLVNSILDGMNLVAKEGAVVNQRDGVIVLSESTGAHEELGEAAVSVNPFDVEMTASALRLALTMAAPERARRAAVLRQVVVERDIARWVRLQLQDLHDLIGPGVPPGA